MSDRPSAKTFLCLFSGLLIRLKRYALCDTQ